MHSNVLRAYFICELFENKINSQYQTNCSGKMVPMKVLALEEEACNQSEYDEGDDFLNDFQLYKAERPAVAFEPDAVCWNLTAVFKEGNAP